MHYFFLLEDFKKQIVTRDVQGNDSSWIKYLFTYLFCLPMQCCRRLLTLARSNVGFNKQNFSVFNFNFNPVFLVKIWNGTSKSETQFQTWATDNCICHQIKKSISWFTSFLSISYCILPIDLAFSLEWFSFSNLTFSLISFLQILICWWEKGQFRIFQPP